MKDSGERIEVQDARALFILRKNGIYVDRNELHKSDCTELIDCLTAKDAKHSVYYLQEIEIRVTQDLAKMYVDNGKEMDGMNNAQRFQY